MNTCIFPLFILIGFFTGTVMEVILFMTSENVLMTQERTFRYQKYNETIYIENIDPGIIGTITCLRAALFSLTVYLRFKHIETILPEDKLNKASLAMGYIIGIVMYWAGSFSNTIYVEMIYTLLITLCVASLIYEFIQIKISFKVRPGVGYKWVNIFRIILFVCLIITFIIALVVVILAYTKVLSLPDFLRFHKKLHAYAIAIVFDFFLASPMFFVVSYFFEFKKLKLLPMHTTPDETRESTFSRTQT